MKTTLSPGGLLQVWRFWAQVKVPAGRSYQDAIYQHRHDPAALAANTRALIAGISKLRAHLVDDAGARWVRWYTGEGRRLPGEMRRLLKAILARGAKGPDYHDFAVIWADAKGNKSVYQLDLGDYFWFVGYASSSRAGKAKHGECVAIARRVIDERFARDKKK